MSVHILFQLRNLCTLSLAAFFALLPSALNATADEIPPLVDMLTHAQVSVQELEATKEIGIAITDIIPDSPAEQEGLQKGDIIVGYDGVRLYEEGETWILRWRKMGDPDIQFVINRKGTLQNFRIHTRAGRVAGYIGEKSCPIAQVAGELGFGSAPETLKLLESYPSRAVALFIKWRAATGVGANADWFKNNLAMFMALRQQNYKEFSLTPEAPVAFIERLSKFYRNISARYREGEHVPEWKAYGEDRTFWALYYPCPVFVPPLWGTPSISDKTFEKAMIADMGLFRASDENKNLARSYLIGPTEHPEDDFVSYMKAALLDPQGQGGWPYRHAGLVKSKDRIRLLNALRPHVQNKAQDWILYAYAMVGPLALEHKIDELIGTIRKISSESPYLGWMSAQTARAAAKYSGREGMPSYLSVLAFVISNDLFQASPAPFHLFIIRTGNNSFGYSFDSCAFHPEYVFSHFTQGFSGVLLEQQSVPPELKGMDLENRAVDYCSYHQYKEAFELCQEAEQIAPPSIQRHWIMGRICTRDGDHAAAMVHFEKALELLGSAPQYAPIRISFIGELLDAYQAQGGKQALFRKGLQLLERSANQMMADYRQSTVTAETSPEKLPLDILKAVSRAEVCKAILLGSEGDWAEMATREEAQLAILRKMIPQSQRQPTPAERKKCTEFTDLVAVFDTACEQLALAYSKMDEPAKALEITKERAKLPAAKEEDVFACRAELDTLWFNALVNGPDSKDIEKIDTLIQSAEKTCDLPTVLSAHLNKARLFALKGSMEAARSEFDDVLQRIRKTSDRRLLANTLAASAENRLTLHQPDLAAQEIGEAVELFRFLGFKSEEPLLLISYAQALAAQKRYPEAVETLYEGVRQCSTLKVPYLALRTLLALADIQCQAGDHAGAAATWAQITSYVAAHPNLPELTLLSYRQARLDWLESLGDAAAYTAERQNTMEWLRCTKLNRFQTLAITTRTFSSIASPSTSNTTSLTTSRSIDLQPVQQRTEVDHNEIARARYTVANLGTSKAVCPIWIRCPGYVAEWTSQPGVLKVRLHPESTAPEISKGTLNINPREEALLLLEAQPADKAQQPATATLYTENQSATWDFLWDDDKRPASILNVSSAKDNPFYMVSFFHDIRIRKDSIQHANLRIETSTPCRVEMIDADRDVLLAIDATGAGTFNNRGDLVYVDSDNDGYPDVTQQNTAERAALELRVHPFNKDQKGKVEIKVSVKTNENWEVQAIDELDLL